MSTTKKEIIVFVIIIIIMTLLCFASDSNAETIAPSNIASITAVVDVASGTLTLTGNTVSFNTIKGTNNDINPASIAITGDIGYTKFTSSKVEQSNNTAIIKLNSKDRNSLIKFAKYKTNKLVLLPGWNGSSSIYYSLSVSFINKLEVTKAYYSLATGQLQLLGNFQDIPKTSKDFNINGAIITDYKGIWLPLSTNTQAMYTKPDEAYITFSITNQIAMQKKFNNGKATILIPAGYNGAGSGYQQVTLTITDYALPTVTIGSDEAKWKTSIKVQSDKLGYVYLVPKDLNITGVDLNTLVTNHTATKVAISKINTDTSLNTSGLKIKADTIYVPIAVDLLGKRSAPGDEILITLK